jgi:glycosyltransferase involved in cell wall biosynthesis
MSKLSDKTIKLVFLGTKHPNSDVKEMSESVQARELAGKLGLTDKTVFFLDDWVPYDQRAAYFMDANAAIYADKESLETRFSHRTRVLDHFWTELPTICSDGDYLSSIVKSEGFGIVIEKRTPEAFRDAIQELATNKNLLSQIKSSLHQKKNQYTWEATLDDLVKFIDTTVPTGKPSPLEAKTVTVEAPPKLPLKRRIRHSAKILLGK